MRWHYVPEILECLYFVNSITHPYVHKFNNKAKQLPVSLLKTKLYFSTWTKILSWWTIRLTQVPRDTTANRHSGGGFSWPFTSVLVIHTVPIRVTKSWAVDGPRRDDDLTACELASADRGGPSINSLQYNTCMNSDVLPIYDSLRMSWSMDLR